MTIFLFCYLGIKVLYSAECCAKKGKQYSSFTLLFSKLVIVKTCRIATEDTAVRAPRKQVHS